MKKVLTIILDGFGLRNAVHGNAVKLAKMPNFKKLWNEYPHSQLLASERAVGLEKGQMGNSEVGHTTIGAGRLIKQNFMEITDWFSKKEILKNENFLKMVEYAKENDKPIHMLGLISDGGIHSHIKFNMWMLDYLHQMGIEKVYVHAITDGRDTGTMTSGSYIDEVNAKLKEYGYNEVASVCGRYYAMDRDKKWDRTKLYSDMLTMGTGAKVKNLKESINFCYQKNVTDEFLPPIIMEGTPKINDGDVIAILGSSGGGKTTILRCINFLTESDKGTLVFDGKEYDLVNMKKSDIANLRMKTGFVFQNYNLFLNKTALENVMEGLVTVRKMDKKIAREIAVDALEKVGLGDKLDYYPISLSGGQQQRVSIARALAYKPEVIYFDEPTSSLDPELTNEVLGVMKDLAKEKVTMVVVTHEMTFARNVSNRIIFLDKGEVICDSDTDSFFNNQKNDRIKRFINNVEGDF